MDRDEPLVGCLVAVEHDFPDQDMGNPLLGSSVRARRIPCRRQITRERHQRRAIDLRAKRRGNVMPSDAVLEMGDPLQRCVPPGLKFARKHHSIRGMQGRHPSDFRSVEPKFAVMKVVGRKGSRYDLLSDSFAENPKWAFSPRPD